MAGGHDTYFPLTAVGGTGDDKWDANTMNTGYIVSGSHASYQQASGDVRVSSAYTFNRGDLTNSVNGNTYYSNRLEVLTRTYKLNGFKRISDSKNGSNNSVSSTLSGIEKVSVNSLGLLKYEAARTQLDTMLLGNASSSTGPIYGMHFMDGVISMENMITAPKVTINGETYTNYQMPEDSIDFKLKTAGYINFFAGTYYMNSGKENNCFFSLNHIFRDENTHEITAIKRISKIYGNPSSKSSEYVYEYEDENGNISYSGSTAGLTMMFDTDWIERPDNFKGYSMYYFEIPVNAGEYALGSVAKQGNESARYGAYLCYLDIGTSGSTEDKDRVTIAERITTENANVAFPKGVQLVEDGGSFNAELPYETATVKLANGYTGDYLLSRTGNVFHYLAQTNASLNYLGGSLTAQQTTGEGDSATTITYHLENGYEVKTIENITDTGKDTGVVDYLRVETVDQFDSSGTRTSRTVTVYADPNLSNNTMDTLEEAASFTYTCADYDGIVVRCVRSASQSGFNVMFSENVTITSVTLQGDYYFNFGDNLKATLDTVNESGTGMSLAIAAVEMSERPASEKEYLYNPSTVGDDLATYYYYYDDEATVTPETTYTLTLGDTIATQTVSDYTITLTSSSGSVTVYATQLIASYEGTVSTLNSTVTPTATTPISVTVTVTPNVKINTTTLAEIGTVQKIEISGS